MSSGCPIPVFIGDIVYGVNLKKNISVLKNYDIPSFDEPFDYLNDIYWYYFTFSSGPI